MKRSKSRINSSSNKRLYYDKFLDIERCQDEIIKMRIKYNKLNQQHLELKVEYNKLEREYKYNTKLMEAIIKEANISVVSEFLDDEKNNDQISNTNRNNEIKQNNLSKSTLRFLREKSIYERLKREIIGLKEELREKENLIDNLKNNIKTSKFKELDSKYSEIFKELNEVKNRNEILENMQQDYFNSKNQIIFLIQQIDLYKKENKKQKEQIEKLILSHKNSIEHKEENDNQKNLEEQKIKMLKYENDKLKKRIKDLEEQNYLLTEKLEKIQTQSQSQIDKTRLKKDNEIKRYKSQIVELKLEVSKLQKKIEEKNIIGNNSISIKNIEKSSLNNKEINKNNIKNANNIGAKKSLKKIDNDFFLTTQKIESDNKKNNEKIVIKSKDKNEEDIKEKNNYEIINKDNLINNNYIQDKEKIKFNNEITQNIILIKGGSNLENITEEKNVNTNGEKSKEVKDYNKIEENTNEDEKIKIDINSIEEGKEKENSKNGNDKQSEENKNIKSQEKNEIETNEENENDDNKNKNYEEKENNYNINQNYEEKNKDNLSQDNKNETRSDIENKEKENNNKQIPLKPKIKTKFTEDEILVDFKKENSNKEKDKSGESMNEYNDFENEIKKDESLNDDDEYKFSSYNEGSHDKI